MGFKKNKYFAKKVVYKGIKFDSSHERDRFIYLSRLEREGRISNLKLQHEFVLIPQTTTIVPVQLKTKVRYYTRVVEQDSRYTCDFIYNEDGKIVVEEFKSEQTAKLQDYRLRRKLMIRKIYEHNSKPNRTRCIFREVVYYFNKNKPTTITDK